MLEVEPGAAWRKVRLALCALLLVRLVSLGLYPVMDNTEARYADIGRAMLATQDWVTPWIEPGVPFWGKPPLSFWITAASLGVFGVNEFAARLPHFLMALLTGWTLWGWARDQARSTGGSAPLPLMAVSLLAGACLMAVAAGAVMTDMSLVAGTTLVMRGFWQAMQETDPAQRQRQGWIFFVGLAVGLLAKGPLILVLAGLPQAPTRLNPYRHLESAQRRQAYVLERMEKASYFPPWGMVENLDVDGRSYLPMEGSLNAGFEALSAYHLFAKNRKIPDAIYAASLKSPQIRRAMQLFYPVPAKVAGGEREAAAQ